MKDLRSELRRVVSFFVRLVREKRWGELRIRLKEGVPTLVTFEAQYQPQDLPQASGSEERAELGESAESVVTELIK